MGSNRKQVVGGMMIVNIAMLAFVSANATCPSLDVCLSIPLLNVQVGSQVDTQCCTLINGILAADVELCLCSLLKQSQLGSVLATTLGLTSGLPIVGGLIGGQLSPIYGLTYSVLNTEVLALVNACGFNPAKYRCAAY